MTNYEQFDQGYKGLFDTTLLDLIPSDRSLDAQCTSYAIFKSMQIIRKYSERLCIYANIDNLQEPVLDYLAMEWRLPYYDSEFSLHTKRNLVKNGFQWNMSAGTPGIVEDLLQSVFGEGSVSEWFDYGGSPGFFKIRTNAMLTPDIESFFSVLLKKAKNVSSWLEKIEIHRTIEQPYLCGVGTISHYKAASIREEIKEINSASQKMVTTVSVSTNTKNPAITEKILFANQSRDLSFSGTQSIQREKPEAIKEGYNTIGKEVRTTVDAGTAINSIQKNIINE